MSPEFSIEPLDLVTGEGLSQLGADLILAESQHREGNRLADGRPEFPGQPFEFFVSGPVDPHAGALHATEHTPLHTR